VPLCDLCASVVSVFSSSFHHRDTEIFTEARRNAFFRQRPKDELPAINPSLFTDSLSPLRAPANLTNQVPKAPVLYRRHVIGLRLKHARGVRTVSKDKRRTSATDDARCAKTALEILAVEQIVDVTEEAHRPILA